MFACSPSISFTISNNIISLGCSVVLELRVNWKKKYAPQLIFFMPNVFTESSGHTAQGWLIIYFFTHCYAAILMVNSQCLSRFYSFIEILFMIGRPNHQIYRKIKIIPRLNRFIFSIWKLTLMTGMNSIWLHVWIWWWIGLPSHVSTMYLGRILSMQNQLSDLLVSMER